MIVCLCEAVSHRTIDDVVCDGAESVREIGRRCGAGTGCGMCKVDLKARLRAQQDRLAQDEPLLSK
ncbi:MAG: (2Fe-2S)-binding protein [Proteobacteria bacterium]|nr:(2Fe-2S)-binding protein [Pseudomonadota bacterium]